MQTQKTIIIGCVVAIFLGIGYYGIYQQKNTNLQEKIPLGETHTVILTEDGYVPEEITIQRGDVVVFSSQRPHEHWPASNVHPTHNLYSAFDPKRPLLHDEEWSFQFTQAGKWEFHDHLNSTFEGVVIVQE